MERITIILQRYIIRRRKQGSGFVQLFISKRLIHGAAGALTGLFLPIFLYVTSGGHFYIVGIFYALLSLGYVLLLVPGMRITNVLGFSRTLALGIVFSVFQFTILFFIDEINIWSLFLPLLITMIGFRIFHWVPYHVNFTAFTKSGERGRDISLTFATIAFMGVVGPVLAGFIIQNAGYEALFGVSIVLLVIAGISYLFVPKVDEQFTWTYAETLRNLFSKKFRNVFVGEFANGAESIVALIAWPIFLFTILDGNVFEVGAVSALIVGVTIVIQLSVGRYLDRGQSSKVKSLRVGSVFYAIGWIFKIFVLSASQIFFVGLYHNVTRIFTKTPYSTILYDMSGEQGHYVDEFTVMREMSGHMGRVVALLVMVGLTFYFSVEWTFLIGALASLLLNAIYRATH